MLIFDMMMTFSFERVFRLCQCQLLDDDDDGNNDNNDDDDILTCACSPALADARKPAPDVFASSDDYYGQNQWLW